MSRPPLVRSALAVVAVLLGLGPTSGGAQVINEVVADHTGTDTNAFVEIKGAPNTDYSATLRILEIEGDASSNPGAIDFVWTVGTTNATGHWASSPATRDPENGTITLLLVSGFSGTLGQDLDTNNDGTLDLVPWTQLLDSVALIEGVAGDGYYSPVALASGFDGVAFQPGGASRIPDGTDTNTIADWVRNDFDGAGFPGMTGTLVAGETLNTPGAVNSTSAPPSSGARLNEFVLDLDGGDTQEYVEIWGGPVASYATTRVLVLDSDTSGNPGLIEAVITPGTTSGAGLWSSGFLAAGTLGDASRTLLVVTDFTGASGQDLDANNDGTLDTTPWATLSDSVAVTDGAGVDLPYSAVVLAPGFDGVAGKVGGASRFPNGVDTDATADWMRNDFERAGLPGGSPATQTSLEALNTPAMPNTILVADYYRNVDATNATTLRATLHAAIDDHIKVPYTSGETDTWDVLNLADEDPVDTGAILDIYKNAVYAKISGGTGAYNREHSWPNSWGFPDDGPSNYPYTDCHHLFASDVDYNSHRNNLPYGVCSAACTEDPTLLNHTIGGGSGTYPGNSNWYTGSANTGTHETWWARRGDVARAQLYLEVRYEGGSHGASSVAEPDLRLTDDTAQIVSTGNNEAIAYMGRLAAILAWHAQDAVDAREVRRNGIVYTYQANRNPFIDHPEWVACLWTNQCDTFGSGFADGFESGGLAAWDGTTN